MGIDWNIHLRALLLENSTQVCFAKTEGAAAAYESASLVKLFMFYLFVHYLIRTMRKNCCRIGRNEVQ